VIIEFRVDDVDAEYTRLKAFVRTDVACDLLALIGHLDGPAVIVGRSISGGAATIATAKQPELVRDRRDQPVHQGAEAERGRAAADRRRYRRGILWLGGTKPFRSLSLFVRYLDVAYPTKPADYDDYMAALRAKLRELGRMAEFMKTFKSTPADAEAQLPNVRCPVLVMMARWTLISPTRGPRVTPSRRPCRPAWARSRWSTAPGTIRTRSRRMRSPRWSSPSSSNTPAAKLSLLHRPREFLKQESGRRHCTGDIAEAIGSATGRRGR
jgi:pimeloyl-ACP methyl ester carboxylesterase